MPVTCPTSRDATDAGHLTAWSETAAQARLGPPWLRARRNRTHSCCGKRSVHPRGRRPPTTAAPATASAPCSWSTGRRPPPSSPPGWASRRPPSAGTSTPCVGAGRLEERLLARGPPGPRPPRPAVPPHRRRALVLPARLRRPRADRAALRRRVRRSRRGPRGRRAAARRPRGAGVQRRREGRQRPRRCAGRPRPGPRRRAHGRGLRCHGLGDLRRRAALPAPLPGGARGGGVPAAVRGRDRGDRPAASARHVQRLATIAHGDGICTTHIPGPLRPGNRSDPRKPCTR